LTRLFVSLELETETVQRIEEWRKPLREKYPTLRWTSEAQLHVTLRFLGNRDPEQVAEEMEALSLLKLLPVEYTLRETGTFGNPPAVLWLSGDFAPNVFTIARRLGSIQDGEGKKSDDRCFTPHITLARVKRGDLYPDIQFSSTIQGNGNAIHLVMSSLSSSGPSYKTLHSISR
jgi:2'-5' RNA ligase